jgi:hypothetical protein
MRKACLSALLLTLAACSSEPPALEAVAPNDSSPVIEQVTYRTTDDAGVVVYPELHFRSPDGNVVAIHRELVSDVSPKALVNFVSDSPVAVSADQQKEGAVYNSGWKCGTDKYKAELRAYLIDANHNHSNTVDYSIDCQ